MLFLGNLARSLATVALVGLATLPSLALGAYAAPGACSGDCWTHDPAVVKRSDGTYFRFSTGGGIGIYQASSLAGPWTYKGVALSGGSSISVTGNSGTDLWVCRVFFFCSSYCGWKGVLMGGNGGTCCSMEVVFSPRGKGWCGTELTGQLTYSQTRLPW